MPGGNEYGQCGEEPERKDDNGRPLRRDIVIPQPCAPKLVVRQVIYVFQFHAMMEVEPNMIYLCFVSEKIFSSVHILISSSFSCYQNSYEILHLSLIFKIFSLC